MESSKPYVVVVTPDDCELYEALSKKVEVPESDFKMYKGEFSLLEGSTVRIIPEEPLPFVPSTYWIRNPKNTMVLALPMEMSQDQVRNKVETFYGPARYGMSVSKFMNRVSSRLVIQAVATNACGTTALLHTEPAGAVKSPKNKPWYGKFNKKNKFKK